MSRRRLNPCRSRENPIILRTCIRMQSAIPSAVDALKQGCSLKWYRVSWDISITVQPLISIPMFRRASIRKRLESLEGRWNRKKRKVKNLRKNGLSGWDRHLGEDMGTEICIAFGEWIAYNYREVKTLKTKEDSVDI